MRAESDADGQGYLGVTEIITNILQSLHDSLDAACVAFDVAEKISTSGFQLTGGDVGLDKSARTWTWTQGIIIYGVVE